MVLNHLPEIVAPLQHGGVGRVEKTITPTLAGQIRFEAVYWWAEWLDPRQHSAIAHPGSRVQVVARRGNTLLVVPLHHPPQVHPHRAHRIASSPTQFAHRQAA
jgi:hypothetical protein